MPPRKRAPKRTGQFVSGTDATSSKRSRTSTAEIVDNGDNTEEEVTAINAAAAAAATTTDRSPSPVPSPSPLPPAQVRRFAFLPLSPNRLSRFDCSKGLRVDNDGLTVTGDKGYRMVRATHGIMAGSLYYEIKLLDNQQMAIDGVRQPPAAALRVGVSTINADIDGPVGCDRFSYGLSSVGQRGHESLWEPWPDTDSDDTENSFESINSDNGSDSEWKSGDVIGCWLYIDQTKPPTHLAAPTTGGKRGKSPSPEPVMIEIPRLVTPPSHATASSPLSSSLTAAQAHIFMIGSQLRFYRNGALIGKSSAFENLFRGVYYPAVSLFMGAKVSVNFGPDFECPPAELTQGHWPPIAPSSDSGKKFAFHHSPDILALSAMGFLTHVPDAGQCLIVNKRHSELSATNAEKKRKLAQQKERETKEREMRREAKQHRDRRSDRDTAATTTTNANSGNPNDTHEAR